MNTKNNFPPNATVEKTLSHDVSFTILESSTDCLKIIDTDGRLQFMNMNGQRLMEIEDFDLYKSKSFWWDLWNEDYQEVIKNALTQALKGKITQFTAPCNTTKGNAKWWDVMVSPVVTKSGNIFQIISISRDITEQKKYEENLRKTQEKLHGGLKVANVALAEVNYLTNTIELSPEAAMMYGLPTKQLKISREEWHNTFHPAYKNALEEEIDKSLKLNNSNSIEVEHPIILPSGEMRWLKVNKQIFFDSNSTSLKPLYSILAAQDITQKKKAEEEIKESENRFRTLANSIPQLAWMMDAQGNIYWYNERWYNYTGTTYEEMMNKGWHHIHHPDLIEGVLAHFKNAILTGQDWEDTFLLKSKQGEYKWFLSRAIPIRNENGEIMQWFGTNTDISVQKETQEALNLLNASLEEKVRIRTEELVAKNVELEQMNNELSSFSFVASHDLQEPLRKIRAFSTRILETETFSERTTDYFNRIISAGERMQNLINDLLNFSRTNATELNLTPCNLNEIIEEIKQFSADIISEKEAILDIDELPTIYSMKTFLSQLFSNLINNALKYSQKDTIPYIKISSSIISGENINLPNVDTQKIYYCISVTDNGIGFEQEYAMKIFELFKRLHGKSEYSGTGVGLTICKKIVSRLNGFIIATSQLNQGATFTIYLPKTYDN
ncbi:PAS domain S-box protein [Arcicella sp. LKC2W]|uniref:PAS domain-containing sensor histidine kinase n=1 Tax=Arcicella sp. LKC2W TaxID=2984198 RepID=UPI002B1F78CB|nr:PAS domain S-box protein [Arcicella sp. LKC2W]MEA5458649.1 PAS domain S-box protein [Arcicella sp. LKC2W]